MPAGQIFCISASTIFSDVGSNFSIADCYASTYKKDGEEGSADQYDSKSTYYKPGAAAYIETAAYNSIIAGYPDGKGGIEFRPSQPLTREQTAVILARVANPKVSDDMERLPVDGESIDALLSLADARMYATKETKKRKVKG
jgi:hypothetical protein